MTEVLDTDVLIVGGGPAGLAVSEHLQGRHSILVHQDREIGKPVRTSGGSWLHDMQRLGIPEEMYQRIDQLDVYSDTREVLVDICDAPAVVLDVTKLYKWQANRSTSDIFCGTKFLRAQRAENGFLSTVRTAGEGEWQIRSRQIVDASGWHCAVLESLGLGEKPARDAVGIEYEYPVKGAQMHRAVLFFGAFALSGYGWAFPTNYQTMRLGVGVIRPDSNASPKDMMAALLASDQLERMQIPRPTNEHVNAGTIPSIAYEKQLVFGDVIRVGDSANMATPTLGEGIRICIEQGRLLGGGFVPEHAKGSVRMGKTGSEKARAELSYRLLDQSCSGAVHDFNWERSLRRMDRLPGHELVAYFKSDFTPGMIVRRVFLLLWRKLKDRAREMIGS